MGIVKALNECEDGSPGFDVGPEGVPIQDLALEGGEERLGDGVGLAFQLHLTALFHHKPFE